MGTLRYKDLLRARPLQTEDVPVPEWAPDDMPADEVAALTVKVRALSGKQRDAFEGSLVNGEGKKRKTDLANIRAKLVAMCIVIGPDDPPWQPEVLGALNAAALDRVFTVCQRLAGLSAADVENLEKNSEPGPKESLPLTSATHSESSVPTDS